MIKHLAIMAVALLATATQAQSITVKNEPLGSGVPGVKGYTEALPVLENNIYHAPQYLPYYPTAATIWPRVVELNCDATPGGQCDGYHWTPAMGRAEYLFVTPEVVREPVIVEKIVPGPERIILKEVPKKKVRE
jgi:hypothetical protein